MAASFEFETQPNIEPIALIKLVQSKPSTYRLAGAAALSFSADLELPDDRFEFVEKVALGARTIDCNYDRRKTPSLKNTP